MSSIAHTNAHEGRFIVERAELLRRIASFPLISVSLAQDMLMGTFRSSFKGKGIEFDEVRRYEEGDDATAIDWNVSARMGLPFIKLYREEHDMGVSILLDCSASMYSNAQAGSLYLRPFDQAVLTTALIAFSAAKTGQRISSVFFDRGINRIFLPRKGNAHIMAMLSAALSQQGQPQSLENLSSNLRLALLSAQKILKRRSFVIIISDFLCVNWERDMLIASRYHDVIAIRISSPVDKDLPQNGLLTIEDAETGVKISLPGKSKSVQAAWVRWHEERAKQWEASCRRCGASFLTISTDDDAIIPLKHFFGQRQLFRGGKGQ